MYFVLPHTKLTDKPAEEVCETAVSNKRVTWATSSQSCRQIGHYNPSPYPDGYISHKGPGSLGTRSGAPSCCCTER